MGTFLKVIGGCVVAVGVAVALPYMISDLIDQKIQKEPDSNATEDEQKTV